MVRLGPSVVRRRRGAAAIEAVVAFPAVVLMLAACLHLGVWMKTQAAADRATVSAAAILAALDPGNSPSGREVDAIAEAFHRSVGLDADGPWAIRLRLCRIDDDAPGGAKCGWNAKRSGDGSVTPPPAMAPPRLTSCTECPDGMRFAVVEAAVTTDPSGMVPSPADRILSRQITPLRKQ